MIPLAVLLGMLGATFVPYVRKRLQKKISGFDPKYMAHMLFTVIWQFVIVSLPVTLAWETTIDEFLRGVLPPAGMVIVDGAVLLCAFAFGYGGNELQKEFENNIRALKPILEWLSTFLRNRRGGS